MKRFISFTLCLILCVTICTSSMSAQSGEILVGEEKLMIANNSGIPKSFIDEILESRTKIENYNINQTTSSQKSSDELFNELSFLYIERAQLIEKQESSNIDYSQEIEQIERKIDTTKNNILLNGEILLTNQEAQTMISYISDSAITYSEDDDIRVPNDTANTEYYLSGVYTTNTDIGSLDYYYITAICTSTKSNMWSSHTIDIGEASIDEHISNVVGVYASRFISGVVDKVLKDTVFRWLPWELVFDYLEPSETQRNSAYNIIGYYLSNVRFVFCYSETFQEYDIGIIMHSTAVNETHSICTVDSGDLIVETTSNSYTIDSDNYNNVAYITREYWESYVPTHFESIEDIQYYYNSKIIATVTPPFAQRLGDLN